MASSSSPAPPAQASGGHGGGSKLRLPLLATDSTELRLPLLASGSSKESPVTGAEVEDAGDQVLHKWIGWETGEGEEAEGDLGPWEECRWWEFEDGCPHCEGPCQCPSALEYVDSDEEEHDCSQCEGPREECRRWELEDGCPQCDSVRRALPVS